MPVHNFNIVFILGTHVLDVSLIFMVVKQEIKGFAKMRIKKSRNPSAAG